MSLHNYERRSVRFEEQRLWLTRWAMRTCAFTVRAAARGLLPKCHPIRIFLEAQTKRTERAVSMALLPDAHPEDHEARDQKIAGLIVTLSLGGASAALIVQTVNDLLSL